MNQPTNPKTHRRRRDNLPPLVTPPHRGWARRLAVLSCALASLGLAQPTFAAPRGYLRWVELDMPQSTYLATYRQNAPTAIASLSGWYAGATDDPDQRTRDWLQRREANRLRTSQETGAPHLLPRDAPDT